MKKARGIALCAALIALSLSLCAASGKTTVIETAAASGKNYSVSNFSELPEDWELSPLCDTQNVTATFDGGDVAIKSTSTQNQSKYYGAMYRLATGETYGDFTFEIRFKMEDPANNDRWLGVMYHTNQAFNGNLVGYLVNFRYSGASAASAVTPSLEFKDEPQISSGVPLSDGEFHTLKIAMKGSIARHYIDGVLITSWDTSVKNSVLGGSPLSSGGFALIVNRSTVTVRSVDIIPTASDYDGELAQTYKSKTDLVGAPAVITDVTSREILETLGGDVRPSNAIFTLNENADAVGKNGEVLGSFLDIYRSLDHKAIPIVRVNDEKSADAFIEFDKTVLSAADMAVTSDDPALLKKVREALPHVRGIAQFTSEPKDPYSIVRESTIAQASTVIVPQSFASARNVAYLQARLKTVWVKEDGRYFGDTYRSLLSGCFGIVTEDHKSAYEILESFGEGCTRNIFNVAHRALPQKYNENSLSGIEAAMRAGVTHLELDGHLTLDKRIVVTHDDKIDRETNGTGVINEMTLEQIRKFDLDLKPVPEKIPTLDEVAQLINKINKEFLTDVVLVFEIKDDSPDFVKYLKAVVEQYDITKNFVVITFENTERQLSALKKLMPHVPTANLDNISDAQFPSRLASLCAQNTVMDNYQSFYNEEFDATLRDRGFMSWYWTFSEEKDVNAAADKGILGVTTNAADCYGKQIRFIEGHDAIEADPASFPSVGDTIPLTAYLYDGSGVDVVGSISYTETTDEGLRAFASYRDENGRIFYTQDIVWYFPQKRPSSLPLILGLSIPFGALALAAAIAVPVIVSKKKKQPKI